MAFYFRNVPNVEYINREYSSQGITDYTQVKNLFKRGKLREDIFGNLNVFTKYQIKGDERPDNVASKFYEDETLDWVILLSNNIINVQSEWPMTQRSFDTYLTDKYGTEDEIYNGVHHYEASEIKDSSGITMLKEGTIIQNVWNTNGNFVKTISDRISSISYSTITGKVTVNLQNGIFGIDAGDQIYITNISDSAYNGQFTIDEIISYVQFTYTPTVTPSNNSPLFSGAGNEIANFVLRNTEFIGFGNSYYYEYFDSRLQQTVIVPSTSFVNTVTNYQYEERIQEQLRSIYVLKAEYLNIVLQDMDQLMRYKKGSTQYVSRTLKRGDNIRLYE